MLDGEPLVCEERLVRGINVGFATATVEPDPLDSQMVIQCGFPALGKAVFGVGPAWPVEIDVYAIEAVARFTTTSQSQYRRGPK